MITETQMQDMTLDFDQEITVNAPLEATFEAMIHQLADGHQTPAGTDMGLRLERRPGGRWYRDLGTDSGHLWGHVQSYRAHDLIELQGPMFMSYPVMNHIIIRFESNDGVTKVNFRHRALGMLQADHREGLVAGWTDMLGKVRTNAES